VVIPCYNYGKYLAEAIESALEQTYRNIEVTVVDDGSTDNTLFIADRYARDIQIIHQENKGVCAARNKGIHKSDGEYVLCLDADDKLDPTCIERCFEQMRIADIVCPGQQEFDKGRNYYRFAPPFTPEAFLKQNRIHCASLFRKRLWTQTGGYDESMRDGYEDWEFWIRCMKLGARVAVIDEPLFLYRKHGPSMLEGSKRKHTELYNYICQKHGFAP
jgi:glycosyltransferase involved in cell wall biosynthesis